ncbi:MAG: CDP-glucose 4,6-dehydratase [Myxococcota bacterium]
MTADPLIDALRAHLHQRSVLVTGHTGFKGAWLTLLLQNLGAHVHGLSLDPEPGSLFELATLSSLCASDHRSDVRDMVAVTHAIEVSKPDLVLHLAAESLVRRSYAHPLNTLSTNVMGTATLLDAVRLHAPETPVVVVTSDKVYRNDGRQEPYSEADHLGGHDPYSASKAACELVVNTYRDGFGLNVASARAGNVIGGGDVCEARLIPDAVQAWRQGRPLFCRSPGSTRPWQHVLEPLAAYLDLGVGLMQGRAELRRGWNIGPVEPAWTVARVLDEAVTHWPGAQWAAGSAPTGPKEAARLDLDPAQALSALTWAPRWNTQTAIARTLGWSHAQHRGGPARQLCDADLKDWLQSAPLPG